MASIVDSVPNTPLPPGTNVLGAEEGTLSTAWRGLKGFAKGSVKGVFKYGLGLVTALNGADQITETSLEYKDGLIPFAPKPPPKNAVGGESARRLAAGGPGAFMMENMARIYSSATSTPLEDNPLHQLTYASADMQSSMIKAAYSDIVSPVINGAGNALKMEACSLVISPVVVDPSVGMPIAVRQNSDGKPLSMKECLNTPDPVSKAFDKATAWVPPIGSDEYSFVTGVGEGGGHIVGGTLQAVNPVARTSGYVTTGISTLKSAAGGDLFPDKSKHEMNLNRTPSQNKPAGVQ